MILTPLAASSAPWWGSSVIAAAAALGGVLLTLVATQQRASIEIRHKDRTRWDELIFDSATTLLMLTARLSESGKVGYPGYVEDDDARMDLHLRTIEEFEEAIARFRLVASKRLFLSALHLYEGAMTDFQGGPTGMPLGVPLVTFEDARNEFTVEVRREIRSNE